MKVTVNLAFNKQELWTLIECLPDNPQGVYKTLYERLSAAREPFERKHQIYGGVSSIRPSTLVNEYHNKDGDLHG